MQLDIIQNLEASKELSIIIKAILQTIRDEKNFLSLIDIFLKEKYQLTGTLTNKILVEAQLASLYNELETKRNHKKLYEAKKIEQVDINGSSIWLHKGNVKATDEARLSYLQDRNLFGDKVAKCPHCNEKYKTVDHLATQCDRMLYHDYMRRNNEVVRCIHLLLCNQYNILRSKD